MTGPAALSHSGGGAFTFLRDGRAHGARGGAESAQPRQHRRRLSPAQAAQPQTAGAGQQRQSPGVLGQQPTPPADNGMESIGIRQDRMSNEQATELLNGIMRPGNVIPDSE